MLTIPKHRRTVLYALMQTYEMYRDAKRKGWPVDKLLQDIDRNLALLEGDDCTFRQMVSASVLGAYDADVLEAAE